MKKIFMIALMAVAAVSASAQDFHITPHVGVGFSHYYNMRYGINEGGTFSAGAEAEYMLNDKFGISGGVDFQFCHTDEHMFEGDSHWTSFNFGYINVPVLAQYHMGQFAVKAGLQPAFNVIAQENYGSDSHSVKDDINTFSLSLPVGVSYELKKTPIVFDLRCAIPLTKQSENFYKYYLVDAAGELHEAFAEGNKGNTKLLTVMLTVGWRF